MGAFVLPEVMVLFIQMELKSLNDKKSELENAFNSLEAEKQEHTKRINEIITEQLKLQGAHSLLEEQIQNFKKEKKNAN